MVKRRVDVTVMGLPLSVRTERDDASMHNLAAQVGRRLEELRRVAKNATTQQLAILVALNLAEELQQERDKTAELSGVAQSTLLRVRAALAALDEEGLGEEEEEDVVVAEA
ncbi:MAG: cell division protein ZapA [Deltaproteobacteria bacterium]|nr:cell division protein ZapA [Deltaproteobacteria bacterium]